MGGCMGQWVGSGQMTNLIKLELINIIWFCLKIYNLSRHPYLWVDGWVNGWAHVKPLKSNKSWPNRDNSIMDILDILLDILLKPPQPFIGLFLMFGILSNASSCVMLMSCSSRSMLRRNSRSKGSFWHEIPMFSGGLRYVNTWPVFRSSSKFDVLKNSLNVGQLNTILPSAVSIGNLCSMRSPTLAFEKFGTYQSSAMVPCSHTKSLMDLSLFLYGSTVGFTFWLCASWGSLSVRCAIALVCTPVLLVGIFLWPCSIFVFQSSITACYRFSVLFFFSTFFAILVFTLCCLSRAFFFFFSVLLGWCLLTSVRSVNCWSQDYCLLSLEKISLAALIGWCIWHFWVKCQLDDHKRDWLCRWVANPWPRSYCFWVEWCGGIDVLQLLFLRYSQGCVNSCHHLLTLTGINCCVWIFSCFAPCCCRPFRYCLSLPVTKLEQFFCIIVFPLFFEFLVIYDCYDWFLWSRYLRRNTEFLVLY